MRRAVAIEGRGPSGHIIRPGAIVMPAKETVPVTFANDLTTIIGKAGNFQRNGRLISMELELDKEWRFKVDLRKWEAVVNLYDLRAEPIEPGSTRLRIEHGVIGAVGLSIKNPGAVIQSR